MKMFLITFIVFGIVLLAMAVGVIFGRRCIRGSCGGVGSCECHDENREKNDLDPLSTKDATSSSRIAASVQKQ